MTLIEAIVGVSVTTLMLVAMISLVTRSMANSQFAKNKSNAARLVEEGLESSRQIRDRASDWEQYKIAYPAGTYSLGSGLTFTSDASCNADTLNLETFSRCAVFSDETDTRRIVTITVYWKDGSGSHQTVAQTYLTQWK